MKRPYGLIALLFLFWVALTGSFAPAELLLGLSVSTLVAFGTRKLLGEGLRPLELEPRQVGRFLLYLPHQLVEVLRANVYVARKVLDPSLPISPVVVPCRYPLDQDASVIALANSITLRPGTLTIDVEDGTFYVHCLAEEFAAELSTGQLYARIQHIFEEE